MSRQLAARLLAVLAALAITLALVAGYVRQAAVDSDQFANRATVALRDDSVRALIARQITDEVVKRDSDLIAARPVIESVTSAIVGSRAFTELFRAGVRDVHRAVFNRDEDTVTLTVADVGTVLAAALERLRPSLAKDVEATSKVELLKRDVGGTAGDLARIADDVRFIATLLAVLSLLLAAAALFVSPDRRRTAIDLGVGAAVGGVVLVLALGVLRSIAIDHVESPDGQAAAEAVWDAFLGDLRTAAWILAASGAVIAAAAASLLRPIDVREPLRRAVGWIAREPERPALRVVRGLAFVAVGLLVLLERDAFLQLVATLVGLYLVYEGVTVLLRLIYKPPAEPVPARRPLVRNWRRLAVPVVAIVLIAGTVAIFVGGGGTTTAAPPSGACNGHRALCDRPLDKVVLPATHNAMSVPLPDWYSAEQDHPIARQLEDGVRGLLIDTHYADRLPNGKLRTYFGSKEELRRQAEQDGVSPDAVDAAQRIRDRLGFRGEGERGMYVCHTFCELGATPLKDVLDDTRDFLVAHPDDVLVVINQDYVKPEDFVKAVEDAGLAKYAYRGPLSGRLPTLREMIDEDRRVVFLAENKAGAAPWYRLAYKQATEETPYTFSKPALLTDQSNLDASCKPNRGPAKAPLLLINHWISTDPFPLPSHASKVNAHDPLLARAKECQRLRNHLPNLLAVNFYKRGDLFGVVDELNGVR